MSEHNIDNFMKLAVYHNSAEDRESDPDRYYRVKYEEIASGKKFSFNWCAFLFSSTWCLYRKMYLYGILWMLLTALYSAGVIYVATYATGAASYITLPIEIKFILIPFCLAPKFFFGFIGNWLYVQQIHKKIDKGYHLGNLRNIDYLTWGISEVLSIVLIVACNFWRSGSIALCASSIGYDQYIIMALDLLLISALGFVTVMYDKRKVAAALAEHAMSEKGSVPEVG